MKVFGKKLVQEKGGALVGTMDPNTGCFRVNHIENYQSAPNPIKDSSSVLVRRRKQMEKLKNKKK
jgi:hypothetical protein